MSGYESSFAGGEEGVEASPQFQHDSSDGAKAEEKHTDEELERIAEEPAGDSDDDLLNGKQAGMTG